MKAETRYIAFDGTAFEYKQDCEYHEIMKRLKAKQQVLATEVSEMMRYQVNLKRLITHTNETLSEINEFFRTPGILETKEHVFRMVDRIKMRSRLKRLRGELHALKPLLRTTNQELCYTERDIQHYKHEHTRLLDIRRQEQEFNSKLNS